MSKLLHHQGLSTDKRTNRWSVTCPTCVRDFSPQTTMLSTDYLTCPNSKCEQNIFVDYNAETVEILEQDE